MALVDFSTIRQYNFPTVVRFGAGAIGELSDHLRGQKLARPLLVTDPLVATLPFFEGIVRQLQQKGLSVDVYSSIHKNPIETDVLAGGEAYANGQRDCIVGIGGGAALDVARAIALRIFHHRPLFDYDDLIGGDQFVTEAVPYFVTVPTTSGTGSEVGRSAIISEADTKRKRILFSPKLLAKIVFADPLLTMDLPPFVTAATGMDALTHNMEAFLAKGFHPMADGIALQGMRLIADSIEQAVHQPNLESRSKMMLASMMGAVAFQKGLGVVHSLAHPLSSRFDTHHGLANAVNLPYGMAFNAEGCEDKFAEMAAALRLHTHDAGQLVEALFALNKRLQLPTTLGQIGVAANDVDALSALAHADFCHPSNPRPVSEAQFKALYSSAL
jgi:alcohol dehydrogenase class IV